MKTATIFDIQKFALHDGPGIRTVIFFKGCHLRCQWCCNPESHRISHELAFLAYRCNSCFNCVSVCKANALTSKDNKLKIDRNKCTVCAECVNECPKDALKIYGYDVTVEELMSIIEKDALYYQNSGGGVTLSGGEVMTQYEFATDLLKACKQKNIHTSIETAALEPLAHFKIIAPFIDLFIIDYKATGTEMYANLTRADSSAYFQTLDYLYNAGYKILIRTPLIPKKNAIQKHFEGIVELSKKYPRIQGIEVMSYHDYGKSKYDETGRPYAIDVPTVTKEGRKLWIDELRKLGAINMLD